MQLIPQARRAYKLASVQVLAAASIAWGVWLTLPPDVQSAVVVALGLDPTRWMPLIAFIGAILARLVAQPAAVPPAAPDAGKDAP